MWASQKIIHKVQRKLRLYVDIPISPTHSFTPQLLLLPYLSSNLTYVEITASEIKRYMIDRDKNLF
jgi:hypothetical protein